MRRLSSVFRVASITAAGMYAVAGLGFAVATLVMGKVLPNEQFAIAVLLIALCNIGAATAPSGINGVVVRYDLNADTRLLRIAFGTALVAASATALIGWSVYGFDAVLTSVLFAAVLAGGTALAAKSSLQQAQQFQKAALLSQSANLGLLIASAVILTGAGRKSWFPTLIVAGTFVLVGIVAWTWALLRPWAGQSIDSSMTRDAIGFGGLNFAGELMVQIERFLIPLVLGIQDLAAFAVLASVALAPFRVLELGAGSTLPTQLRRTSGPAERRRLLYRDTGWLLVLGVAGGGLIVAFGAYVCRYVLPDIDFPESLLLAVVVSGIVRVFASVALSVSGAFCTSKELQRVHAVAWISVVISVLGGFLLARLGLVGLIYGVTCGWLFRAAAVFYISRNHLHLPGRQEPPVCA